MRPKTKKHRKDHKNFRGQYDAKSKRVEEEAAREELSKENDPRWYGANPELIRDYANLPFGDPLGAILPTNLGPEYGGTSIPGVMRLGIAPTWGESSDQNSPINVASRNIYTFVRHANSGAKNYDAPDLMLYIGAMDSCYTYHEWMKRIVRIALDYSIFNRYYPEALFTAMGVDSESIRANLNDLRGYINTYAVKIGSMCVPASMSLTARHMWLNSSLFVDSTTAKAQTYLFSNDYYFQFQWTGNPEVGSLIYVDAPSRGKLATYNDIVAFGNTLINPVLMSEDMNIMSGDILKAFGADGVVKLAGITEGEAVLPTYSREVLSQIENATVFTGSLSGGVSQATDINTGYLNTSAQMLVTIPYSKGYSSSGVANLEAALNANRTATKLNFHWDNPTPDDVVVATRLTNIPQYSVRFNDTYGYLVTVQPQGFSSEIVTSCNIYYYLRSGTQQVTLSSVAVNAATIIPIPAPGVVTIASDLSNFMFSVTSLAQFDWAPETGLFWMDSDGNVSTTNMTIQDTDMYTVATVDNLRNMSMAAIISQLTVPQMGKFASKLS